MAHVIKFIHTNGDDATVARKPKELLAMGEGSVIRLEHGSDGKLLSAAIIKQNGVFEPTFTLRAGDIMAASFVSHYAEMLEVCGANQEKVVSAQACAKTFRDYAGPKKKAASSLGIRTFSTSSIRVPKIFFGINKEPSVPVPVVNNSVICFNSDILIYLTNLILGLHVHH